MVSSTVTGRSWHSYTTVQPALTPDSVVAKGYFNSALTNLYKYKIIHKRESLLHSNTLIIFGKKAMTMSADPLQKDGLRISILYCG